MTTNERTIFALCDAMIDDLRREFVAFSVNAWNAGADDLAEMLHEYASTKQDE